MGIETTVRVKLPFINSPSQDMIDKWETMLKQNAERMHTRLKEKVSTDGEFQNKIVNVAIPKWLTVLNPAHVSEKERTYTEMRSRYTKRLKDSYTKWLTKLDLVFAEVDGIMAKRFKDRVTASKPFWETSVARYVLPLMGDKVRGIGPAPIIASWLVGDSKATSQIQPGDTATGAPYNITRFGMKSPFKAGLIGILQRTSVGILMADLDPADVSAYNDVLNSFAQGFVNPALGLEPFTTGGLSHIDFVVLGSTLAIEAQVSTV